MEKKKKLTDKRCKLLGIEMAHSRVYHSSMVRNQSDVRLVFMPLLFMTEEHRKWFDDNDIVAVYEEVARAGPRSFNGMPTFASMNPLSRSENEKVIDAYNEEAERMKELMDDSKEK